MFIYLSYERNRHQWNGRILLLLLLSCVTWVFFSFIQQPSSGRAETAGVEHVVAQEHGQFSVLTYNIAGLPEFISSAVTPRAESIQQIGDRLGSFDIVNVQEDFNYNSQLYKDNVHPHRTASKGVVPFGDGLSTLSRYPIIDFERIPWSACSGADCLTPKGFSYARLLIAKGVYIDVYNVHATAQDHRDAVEARNKNLQQLTDFIVAHSSCQAVLVMGDFNAHYAFAADKVRDFQQETGVLDTWVILQNRGEFPMAAKDFKAAPALDVTERCESIDKIYFRNSDHLLLFPQRYQVESGLFTHESASPLSDHCAISADFTWQLLSIDR